MSDTDLRDRIIDTAVELAAASSWEAVRLYQIADELLISLEQIRQHFREKDELIDAWFDRADKAMLDAINLPGFEDMTARQRIHYVLMSWLQALGKQQQVTRQMIQAKLEFGHIHMQFPALLRVSRTVQWLREAAQRDARLPRRALEETGLTAIYLLTFMFWLNDRSANYQATRTLLDRKLSVAEKLDRLIYRQHCCQRDSGS